MAVVTAAAEAAVLLASAVVSLLVAVVAGVRWVFRPVSGCLVRVAIVGLVVYLILKVGG
jgi:hypothetical protein